MATTSSLPLVLATAGALAGQAGFNLPALASQPAPIEATAPIPTEASFITTDGRETQTNGRVDRAADGMFYVRAKVNGHRVRFLVDTGASVMVLTPRDAAAVGVTPRAGGYGGKVQTAGGNAAMAWARLDTVELAGRQVNGVRAAVVRGGLGVSLLGQNMLSRMEMVSIEGDQLRLR